MSIAITDRWNQRTTTGQRTTTDGRIPAAGRMTPTQRMAPVRSARQELSGVSLAERVVLDRSVGWSSDLRMSAGALRRGKERNARLRGRIVLFAATILTLVGLVVTFGQLAGASDTSGPQSTAVTMTVESGDSLWAIAIVVAPSIDPRETVERIRELNGLRDSVIVPGQQLIVPQGA